MKLKNLALFILLLLVFNVYAQSENKARNKENFNEGWKFSLTDSTSYSEPGYDDSSWRVLNLPHDWSIEADCSKENSGRNAWLPGGVGWYRKSFDLAKEDEGSYFEIQFDGIYRHSKIWVNGVFIGVQYDGYTSFYFDITEALVFGRKNTIAVRVDNSVQPNCRWYSGSGIYRNVWLTKASPLHVKNWGTSITTPELTASQAEVSVRTTIENMDFRGEAFVLETIILDESGKRVVATETTAEIGSLRSADIEQKLVVTDPKRWSLDNAYLYKVLSKIKVNGQLRDEYESYFGIRKLEFNAEKGFFLNGENLKMKGVCLHHDAGSFGAAVPEGVWLRRLNKLKALGCNAIRTSHNPPSPEFLDLCDRLGFLVMDEFVDKWDNISEENAFYDTPFADPYFHTEWQKNYEETIRRDRNHPSIIIWSIGNENHPSGDPRQNAGLKRYCSFVRSIDPTRPVISGMERGPDLPVSQKIDNIIRSCSFMDLIALNYGEQWCKLIAEKNPGKPYVSTESYTYFNSSLEKRWANIERNPWLDVMDSPSNMGLFLWVGINYLGESRRWPGLGSSSGLLDMAGFRTMRSTLFEAFWSDKPVIHLSVYKGDADDFSTSGRWGWPPMTNSWNLEKGKQYDLATYTNCEEVDLFLNGHKIGTQQLEDFPNWIMKWRKVAFEPGVLKAVGKIDGKPVCEAKLVTVGEPKKLAFELSDPLSEVGKIIQVEVSLTDKKGNLICDNDQQLQFRVEGNGKIMMLTNGKNTTEESLQQKEKKNTHNGKLLCVIMPGDNAGKLILHASGKEIKEQMFEINVKE